MLLLSKKLVRRVEGALSAVPAGPVAMVGVPRLGKALAGRGQTLCPFEAAASDAPLGALITQDLGKRDDWSELLASWQGKLDDSALILSLDRCAPSEVSRRFLCGGLTEVRQEMIGRRLMTTGRVPAALGA